MRAERILALYVERGLTYAEIAAEVGISRQRVHQIITAALAEAAKGHDELAEFALVREIGLIEAEIREAAQILLRKCGECAGAEEQRVLCGACEGTGYFYLPRLRLAAIDRIGHAQDRRIKLLGLEKVGSARSSSQADRDFYAELELLTDEELAEEIESLRAATKEAGLTRDAP